MTFIDYLDFIVNNKTLQNYLSFMANIIAVIGIPISAYQIFKGRSELMTNQNNTEIEEIRKNKAIQIFLKEKNTTRKICLPNKIRRGELTRAEVLGRLGMIPMLPDPENQNNKQRRFEIKKNATEEFIRDIDSLRVSSEDSELFINCETEEMNQFDINEIKKLGFDVWGFD